MESPTKDEVIAVRNRLGLTMKQCAALLHTTQKVWENYEYGRNKMHPAFWELFLLKAGAHSTNLIAEKI